MVLFSGTAGARTAPPGKETKTMTKHEFVIDRPTVFNRTFGDEL